MKHWSLVFFTLLSQTAFGMYAFSSWLQSPDDNTLLLVELILLIVAFLLSLSHLGSPFRAYWAVANLRKSWLSREIFFGLFFTAGVALHGYLVWQESGTQFAHGFITGITLIFGFLFVLSMGILYRLRTVAIWNTVLTPITFFLTSLILGGAVVVLLTYFQPWSIPAFTGLFVLIPVKAVVLYLWRVRVHTMDISDKIRENNKIRKYNAFQALQFSLVLATAIFLVVAILSTLITSVKAFLLAMLFMFINEIFGRYMFYSAEEWVGDM